MTTTLLLVRHGEAGWDAVDGVLTRDPPLTVLGREQAQRLGPWLKDNYTVNAFYASTLARARETAEIVNESLHSLPIIFKDELREWPHEGGVLSVLPRSDQPFDPDDPFGRRTHEKLPPEYWSFAEPIFKTLKAIVQEHWNETILIVCHGGVISTIVRGLMGGHRMPLHFENTGVSQIFWEEAGVWVIGYLNRREHLL